MKKPQANPRLFLVRYDDRSERLRGTDAVELRRAGNEGRDAKRIAGIARIDKVFLIQRVRDVSLHAKAIWQVELGVEVQQAIGVLADEVPFRIVEIDFVLPAIARHDLELSETEVKEEAR